jgi:RND superfamily putative drug exporter
MTLLEQQSGRDSLDPTTIVVAGSTRGAIRASGGAAARLERLLRADPQVASVSSALPDRSGRDLMMIPAARFPHSVLVLAGGGAAYAADFVSRTLGPFPWLVLAVLALTYLLLVRAFRSLLLPLKAIVLNLLTVAAASGLMIAVFQWGWGRPFGLVHVGEIEGWIPVFMFTLLFGLSMDYEVFLVSRMREVWERTRSNNTAVAHGLASTGRIVTAAGLIMAATFSGMLLGSIPTMQQLGFGLAVAIVIDITVVRALLLPSAMTLAGSWNWYLPAWAARLARLPAPARVR